MQTDEMVRNSPKREYDSASLVSLHGVSLHDERGFLSLQKHLIVFPCSVDSTGLVDLMLPLGPKGFEANLPGQIDVTGVEFPVLDEPVEGGDAAGELICELLINGIERVPLAKHRKYQLIDAFHVFPGETIAASILTPASGVSIMSCLCFIDAPFEGAVMVIGTTVADIGWKVQAGT